MRGIAAAAVALLCGCGDAVPPEHAPAGPVDPLERYALVMSQVDRMQSVSRLMLRNPGGDTRELAEVPIGILDMSFEPGGKQLVVCTFDDLFVIDSETGAQRALAHMPMRCELSFQPGGRLLSFVGSRDDGSYVFLIDLGGGAAQPLLARTDAAEARWSPDGKTLLIRNWNGELFVHDLASGQETPLPFGPVTSEIFLDDGKLQISNSGGTEDCDLEGLCGSLTPGYGYAIELLGLSPGGSWLAYWKGLNNNRTLVTIEQSTGRTFVPGAQHTTDWDAFTFSPDGDSAAFVGGELPEHVWLVSCDGKQARDLGYGDSMAFKP